MAVEATKWVLPLSKEPPVLYTQRASHNTFPCGTGGLRPTMYEYVNFDLQLA
ncbi:MAG: hypothetical protein K2O96_06370 [Lachnospiraceae bacterium]|nr:hypothetical protein [Lachnospiraceae bacterium]